MQGIVEDDDLRDNITNAYESARDAYDRLRSAKKKAKSIFDDKKLQNDLKNAADAIRDAGRTLARRRHKARAGRRCSAASCWSSSSPPAWRSRCPRACARRCSTRCSAPRRSSSTPRPRRQRRRRAGGVTTPAATALTEQRSWLVDVPHRTEVAEGNSMSGVGTRRLQEEVSSMSRAYSAMKSRTVTSAPGRSVASAPAAEPRPGRDVLAALPASGRSASGRRRPRSPPGWTSKCRCGGVGSASPVLPTKPSTSPALTRRAVARRGREADRCA